MTSVNSHTISSYHIVTTTYTQLTISCISDTSLSIKETFDEDDFLGVLTGEFSSSSDHSISADVTDWIDLADSLLTGISCPSL